MSQLTVARRGGHRRAVRHVVRFASKLLAVETNKTLGTRRTNALDCRDEQSETNETRVPTVSMICRNLR